MPIDSSALKSAAKEALRASKTSPWLFGLIFYLITLTLSVLDALLSGGAEVYGAMLNGSDLYRYVAEQEPPTAAQSLLQFAISFMIYMLSVGFALFALKVWRRQPNSLGNLFDGFAVFAKAAGIWAVSAVLVFLWSLLFIIPGIIAALRYSQAVYIMLDDPGLGVMECIEESKRLMDGRKSELFWLELSFIGWRLVAVLPFAAVFIQPYYEATLAGWYDSVVFLDRRERGNTPGYDRWRDDEI